MNKTTFDGQQSDEKIISVIHPHPTSLQIHLMQTVILCVFFYLVLFSISQSLPILTLPLEIGGLVIIGSGMIIALWWFIYSHAQTRTYITDRRIIRFEAISPFVTTKRALFWSEVLKAKAYQQNLFIRLFGYGTVVIEPKTEGNEDIRISEIGYYEDFANYIDKILYLEKNDPTKIAAMKPFVAKPKGKRDET